MDRTESMTWAFCATTKSIVGTLNVSSSRLSSLERVQDEAELGESCFNRLRVVLKQQQLELEGGG
jgi:hypothetical protein